MLQELYNFKKRKLNKKVILLIYDVSGWFFIWKYHSEMLFEKCKIHEHLCLILVNPYCIFLEMVQWRLSYPVCFVCNQLWLGLTFLLQELWLFFSSATHLRLSSTFMSLIRSIWFCIHQFAWNCPIKPTNYIVTLNWVGLFFSSP